jgi:hypothetical protein
MIPVEVFFVFLLAVFGLIGTARKFPVELGSTIGFTAMLFSLLLGAGFLGRLSVRIAAAAGLEWNEALARWVAISAFIGLWVVFMYVGQTLTFAGAWPPSRVVGLLMDAGIGVFNGWLVAGTWWYYSSELGYPMQALGWVRPDFSSRAASWALLTPPALVPAGYGLWVVCAFLVFLIALRVFR